MKELNPEAATWASTTKTNAILADIFDVLAMINANLTAIGSGKAAHKPKPYPRPGNRDTDDTKHIGKGGLPPKELREWIEKKRALYGRNRNSAGDHNSDPGT